MLDAFGLSASTFTHDYSVDDAKGDCSQKLQTRKNPPPPNPPSLEDQSKCLAMIENVMGSPSNALQQVLNGFDHPQWKCDLPPISCGCCRSGNLGGYSRATKRIKLCSNNMSSEPLLDSVLTHELTHALQDCQGWRGNSNCERSLKWELEAYTCSGDCYGQDGSPDFDKCMSRAVGSSCPGHCSSAQITPKLFESLRSWHESNSSNFCSFPRTQR